MGVRRRTRLHRCEEREAADLAKSSSSSGLLSRGRRDRFRHIKMVSQFVTHLPFVVVFEAANKIGYLMCLNIIEARGEQGHHRAKCRILTFQL